MALSAVRDTGGTAGSTPGGPAGGGSAGAGEARRLVSAALRSGVRGTLVVAHRDVLRQVRHPGVVVAQAAQIVFFVLVYAVGFRSMIGSVGGVSFGAYVYPGIIAIQVVMLGVGTGLTYAMDREFGVLREMQVAPVPRMCLPLGKILASCVLLTAQAMLMLLPAPLLGLPLTPARYAAGAAVYLATAAAFSLIGLLLAVSVRRIETLQATVQLAMYPLLFLSGSVFKPDAVPGWLAALMRLNPMTYAVDLARHVLLPSAPGVSYLPVWRDLLVIAALVAAASAALRLRVGR
ncbi:ABC transporter permease [Microbispora sp. ATCC PTA-5024]|uniref:ABC transporter permease n=1 Tax=Microbispora sp. ATCC PTA-5024 TaxID=316330 RepID=UPI00040B6329|nr:ABC transporter permease [Microbispora sp. ATCC PTA-5024]